MPGRQRDSNVVIVLGMHRSGTSCLAGSLEAAGLYLGEVNVQAPYNERGNRERRRIMDFHDTLLADNGAAWDAPPPTLAWQEHHRRERDAIIASYPTGSAWGFKDPRTLLTLAGWLDALPYARLAASFRHPLAVAASLNFRNGFDTDKALTLWCDYNRRLLRCCEEISVPLLCFDWPAAGYRQRLCRTAAELGLPRPENAVNFFDGALRSGNVPADGELPDEVGALYRGLQEHAA